jgi:hypothetical protein
MHRQNEVCLASLPTEETILVCGKPAGHRDNHLDPVDNVEWPQDEQQYDQREAA